MTPSFYASPRPPQRCPMAKKKALVPTFLPRAMSSLELFYRSYLEKKMHCVYQVNDLFFNSKNFFYFFFYFSLLWTKTINCLPFPQLDSYEIAEGKSLKINVSEPKTRLFLGNIPKSKGKEEIEDEMRKLTGKLPHKLLGLKSLVGRTESTYLFDPPPTWQMILPLCCCYHQKLLCHYYCYYLFNKLRVIRAHFLTWILF